MSDLNIKVRSKDELDVEIQEILFNYNSCWNNKQQEKIAAIAKGVFKQLDGLSDVEIEAILSMIKEIKDRHCFFKIPNK